MLMFECPQCHKCFFMEDTQIVNFTERNCPNCGLSTPRDALRLARTLCTLPEREDCGGWDIAHLPDKHFTVQVSVTSPAKSHE